MAVFVLNTPVLTAHGLYRFESISPEQARRILEDDGFVSAVGHEGTSKVLSQLLGIEVPTNRIQIRMKPGDRAVVFRLLVRLEEGKVLSESELRKVPFEIGLLTRLE